jgi:hypothetical protein
MKWARAGSPKTSRRSGVVARWAAISSRALEANIEALPDACDCFFGSAHPCSKAAEIASMTAGESGASEVKFAVR